MTAEANVRFPPIADISGVSAFDPLRTLAECPHRPIADIEFGQSSIDNRRLRWV